MIVSVKGLKLYDFDMKIYLLNLWYFWYLNKRFFGCGILLKRIIIKLKIEFFFYFLIEIKFFERY